MNIKDLFSAGSDKYARYRPQYPNDLIRFLASLTPYRGVAWDCATGNGQLAVSLADYYSLVCATDISAAQIKNAPGHNGILYSVQQAEHTDFPEHFFDLVTVGQAIHWINTDLFYAEVKRVLKPGGIIAIIGYGLCSISPEVDKWLQHFYADIVGAFWEPERKIIEENYQTISFPFATIATPTFSMKAKWTLEQFIGYLGTWSAVAAYQKQNGVDPIAANISQLEAAWGKASAKEVVFPLLLKIGRVN